VSRPAVTLALPDDVTLETDVAGASWIAERALPSDRRIGVRVGEVIPTGFDAYARIFHPAFGPDGSKLRWREVARDRGRVVHAQMQFEHLIGTLDLANEAAPREADLPVDEIEALVETLSEHTAHMDHAWFCVWDGFAMFGGGTTGEAVRRAPRARMPWRGYLVFRGPLSAAARLEIDGFRFTPNLWWPDDRTWCVATEIDGYSTYVGGTAACIDAVLADERVEALATSADARFDVWSDEINPRPSGPAERSGG
jgi:hypothetical protein